MPATKLSGAHTSSESMPCVGLALSQHVVCMHVIALAEASLCWLKLTGCM